MAFDSPQLLTESLLLSAGGCAVGLLLAIWGNSLVKRLLSSGSFWSELDFEIDPRVLLAAVAVCLMTGIAIGLAPALQATRPGLMSKLRGGSLGGTYGPSRLKGVLIVAQIALAVTILTGTGLLVRSVAAVRVDRNFDPNHVVLLRMRTALAGYTPYKTQEFHREILTRLRDLPGVLSASLGGRYLGGVERGDLSQPISLPGQDRTQSEQQILASRNDVTPAFFETLGIPLLSGRVFSDRDRVDSPAVAILNETLARRIFRGRNPIESVLMVGDIPHRVVGIAGDVQYLSNSEAPAPVVYLPYWQNGTAGDSRLFVRVAGDPQAMLHRVRLEVGKLDANVAISEDMTMTEALVRLFTPLRLLGSVLGYSGILSLVLGAMGLYGLISFSVNQRAKEIGLRMALGSSPDRVLQLMMRDGIRFTCFGLLIGLPLTGLSTRLMSAYLYGVSPWDPATLAAVVLLMGGVAAVACYLPARRAAKVDPMMALRQD